MEIDTIRALVNGLTCEIQGVRYTFSATGIGKEKYCDAALPRHLLEVECVADSDGDSARFRLLVWVNNLSELPALLRDALDQHLSERQLGPGAAHPRRRRSRSSQQDFHGAKSA